MTKMPYGGGSGDEDDDAEPQSRPGFWPQSQPQSVSGCQGVKPSSSRYTVKPTRIPRRAHWRRSST